MTEQFKEKYWYWRFVEFVRVISLTAMIQFVDNGSVIQIFVGILLSGAWELIENLCEPYHEESINNDLAKWSLFSVSLTLSLAGLLQSMAFEDGDDATVISGVADILLVITVFLPYIVLLYKKLLKKLRGTSIEATSHKRRERSNSTLSHIYRRNSLNSVSSELNTRWPESNTSLASDGNVERALMNPVYGFGADATSSSVDIGESAIDLRSQAGSKKKKKLKHTLQDTLSIKVGDQVQVEGYPCSGIVMFVGPHHVTGLQRVGVELEKELGKSNGTVRGHQYFVCKKEGQFAVLVNPDKVHHSSGEYMETA